MRLTKYYQSAFTVATSAGSSVAVDLGSEMPPEIIQGLGTLAGVVISHKHPDHLHIDHLALEFNADGKSLLYLGDIAVATELPSNKWDAVLVPVGGSKVFTPEAALEFISQLDYQGLVVPVHYHGRADRTAGSKFRDL